MIAGIDAQIAAVGDCIARHQDLLRFCPEASGARRRLAGLLAAFASLDVAAHLLEWPLPPEARAVLRPLHVAAAIPRAPERWEEDGA